MTVGPIPSIRVSCFARVVTKASWRGREAWEKAMRRRVFISAIAIGAALPIAVRAQQFGSMRRIAILLNLASDDPEGRARMAAFQQALQQLGWSEGHNVQIVVRWGMTNAVDIRKHAAELVALAPDAMLAGDSRTVGALQQATRAIPIVFVAITDPVGAGFVDSLARPGGNITGLTNFEYAIGGKWLELLKEIAPGIKRVAVLRDVAVAAGPGQLGAVQTAAPSFGVEVNPINVRDAAQIERAMAAFARSSNDGLIVTAGPMTIAHRDLITKLAARHRLPSIYSSLPYVTSGGLISYGPDRINQYRQAASYVDRILKGEKPADLPIQAPTRYELAINLKTAKALGLTVPPTLLARADEVIE
jgi:putative tryptophan/tyrosine transport system substrate-binding protein